MMNQLIKKIKVISHLKKVERILCNGQLDGQKLKL